MLASIAVEEMLHAGLVANLLTSINGLPTFYDPKAMPIYPLEVPFLGLRLHLKPLTKDCIKSQFMKLEAPCSVELDLMTSTKDHFSSIGAFYGAIEAALDALAEKDANLFAKPNIHLQLDSRNYKVVEHNSADSGSLHPITSIEDARAAINTIMHQGEGVEDSVYADAQQVELTHFKKLQLISEMDLEFYPCIENPRISQYPASIKPVAQLFNLVYSFLMLSMQEIYTEADSTGRLNLRIFVLMEKFLRPLGQLLCATPLDETHNCGPTFEPVHFEVHADPIKMIRDLSASVLEAYPSLQEKMLKGLKVLA